MVVLPQDVRIGKSVGLPAVIARSWRLMAVLAVLWLAAPHRAAAQAAAPPGPDPDAFFNASVSAYEAGDYQKAVDNAKKVLSMVPEATAEMTPAEKAQIIAKLEPMYFTLGAAYFGLKDWSQATAALEDYVKRYPRGGRVTEAGFSIAEANFFAKNFDAAAKGFAAMEGVPAYRELALLLEGLSYQEAGKGKEAIAALEKLYANGITNPTVARGAMRLVELYSAQQQPDKAFKVLADLQANINQVENIVELNAIALKQGDAFLDANKGGEAIVCYRAVRTRNEVLLLQRERIADLERQSNALKLAMRADPKNAGQYIMPNRRLLSAIAEDQAMAQTFEKLPSFRPQLLYRFGRAYALLNRYWEAAVAYNDVLGISKDEKEREPALFALASAYVEVNEPADARAVCDAYLKEFPKGPNAFTVGYMLGATALQENDPKLAEGYFGRMLTEQPDSSLAGEMRYLLANAKFAQGKFDEAKVEYERYQKDYANGPHQEECVYRVALGNLFSGNYEEALKGIDGYLQHYGGGQFGGGQFVPDAKYRRLVCLYAAQKYLEVAAGCEEWLKQYKDDQQQGEVGALLGDAQAALGQPELALTAYQRSYQTATTDEVLNYSIQEAAKILQKQNRWPEIDTMFEEFVHSHPDHQTVGLAITWIARAKTKAGKLDEAKQYLADYIKKYIDDAQRGAVEGLLDQLATLCLRRKAPSPTPAASPAVVAASPGPSVPAPDASPGSSPAVAAASPTPEATPAYDPNAELISLLGAAAQDQRPTAQARLLYARAQLARLRRQEPEASRLLQEVGTRFKPTDLSATLLAQAGDALLDAGKPDAAAPLYQALMDDFHKSDVIDFAYNGLGEIAFRKGKYEDALGYFDDGINKIVPALKLKELTLGRAKTRLALGRYDEAKKLFEQVASTREWRGEATAFSVYSLGEIEAKQGHWAEANAFYQRVFVAYAKFTFWAAKAYLGSAQSLEKLGKPQDAINTYREMLRNERLASLPEADQARERLKAMGAG